jgi:hypothetical protein
LGYYNKDGDGMLVYNFAAEPRISCHMNLREKSISRWSVRPTECQLPWYSA